MPGLARPLDLDARADIYIIVDTEADYGDGLDGKAEELYLPFVLRWYGGAGPRLYSRCNDGQDTNKVIWTDRMRGPNKLRSCLVERVWVWI